VRYQKHSRIAVGRHAEIDILTLNKLNNGG